MMKRLSAALALSLLLAGSAAVADDYSEHVRMLHWRCSQGDRGACVRFGIEIGRHQERLAEWHHSHPDWFWYEH